MIDWPPSTKECVCGWLTSGGSVKVCKSVLLRSRTIEMLHDVELGGCAVDIAHVEPADACSHPAAGVIISGSCGVGAMSRCHATAAICPVPHLHRQDHAAVAEYGRTVH